MTDAQTAFSESYTAWRGYASTAAMSVVPGAVPVSAPVLEKTAWALAADRETRLLALRQRGQATWLYVAARQGIAAYSTVAGPDAADGASLASIDLGAAVAGVGGAAFVDAVLAVPLCDGSVVVLDEDLKHIWQSEPMALPSGAAVWDAATQVVGDDDAVAVAFSADADGVRTVALVSLSALDGSVRWSRRYEVALPAEGAAAPFASPALFECQGALLLSDGVSMLRFLHEEAGSGLGSGDEGDVAESVFDLSGDGVAQVRVAQIPNGLASAPAFLFTAFDVAAGRLRAGVASADVAAESYQALTSLDLDAGAALADPVFLGGQAQLVAVASDGSGDAAVARLLLPVRPDEGLQLAGAVQFPGFDTAHEACQLATAYGERAAEACADVLMLDARGTLVRARYAAGDLTGDGAKPKIDMLHVPAQAAASDADPAASTLLADRSGAVFYVAADGGPDVSANTGVRVVALAPDEDHAVATDVGGATGLDTLGGALTGISLPTGTSLGAGVLVFALGFGAYACIRNRGGRAARDEGLDEWRREHDGSAADRRGRGRRP